jgi:integrase
MRCNEVARLEKATVDLNDAFPRIYIHRTKSGNPKTVEMNKALTKLLKEAMKEDNYFHVAESDFVFTNPKTGKPYTSIKTSLIIALRKIGLEDFTYHRTRHTFCSRLVEMGVPEATIMEPGGWSTRSMMNRYEHPSREHTRESMKNLDSNRTTFSEGVIGGNRKALIVGNLKEI